MRQALLEEHQAAGTALHAAAGVFDPVAALYGSGVDADHDSVDGHAPIDGHTLVNSHTVVNA